MSDLEKLSGEQLTSFAALMFEVERAVPGGPPSTDEELRARCRARMQEPIDPPFDATLQGVPFPGKVDVDADFSKLASAVNKQLTEALLAEPIDPRGISWKDIEVNPERMQLAWDKGATITRTIKVEPRRRWQAQSHEAVEQDLPAPFIGSLEGEATLAPLRFEVLELRWQRPSAFDYQGRQAEAMRDGAVRWHSPPLKKGLSLVTRQRPRGDEYPGSVEQDGSGVPYVEVTFHASFDDDRPDALCIRELVLLAMRHELEESIKVNDVRIWDPHVGRPFGI
jgi:hypothetical protein